MTNSAPDAGNPPVPKHSRKELRPAVEIIGSMVLCGVAILSWLGGSDSIRQSVGWFVPVGIDAYFLSVLMVAAVQSDAHLGVPKAKKTGFGALLLPKKKWVALLMVHFLSLTHAAAFAGAYRGLGVSFHKGNDLVALDQLDSLYFSVVTLATVGYGDIAPATPAAKWFVMLEIISGMILLLNVVTFLISRISDSGDKQ